MHRFKSIKNLILLSFDKM